MCASNTKQQPSAWLACCVRLISAADLPRLTSCCKCRHPEHIHYPCITPTAMQWNGPRQPLAFFPTARCSARLLPTGASCTVAVHHHGMACHVPWHKHTIITAPHAGTGHINMAHSCVARYPRMARPPQPTPSNSAIGAMQASTSAQHAAAMRSPWGGTRQCSCSTSGQASLWPRPRR